MEAETLKAKGYRYTSRKHKIAARIDRPDWREYMAERAAPWDAQGEGKRWVDGLGDRAADYYRRVYSKDKIETPILFKGIPNSTHDSTGYIA